MRLAEMTTSDLLLELEARFIEAAKTDDRFYMHVGLIDQVRQQSPLIVLTKTREETSEEEEEV